MQGQGCFAIRRRQLATLLAAALVGGHGLSRGAPRTLTLSTADLDRWVQPQLPMRARVLEVIDLSVQSLKTGLLPEAGRLSADAGLSGRERIFGRPFTGRLVFDGIPRYDAAGQSLRLEEIRVASLALDDLPAQAQSAVRGLGPVLVEKLLKDRMVYRFKPEDLQRAADLGLQPQSVQVTPGGIELTLVPF
jgi:hypothetical protein